MAGVLYNAMVVADPLAGGGEQLGQVRAALHYGLHVLVVTTSLAHVDAGVRPDPGVAHQSLPAQMVYLFLMSVVPTVPGAWLTFASGSGVQGLRHPPAAVGHQRHVTTSRPPG